MFNPYVLQRFHQSSCLQRERSHDLMWRVRSVDKTPSTDVCGPGESLQRIRQYRIMLLALQRYQSMSTQPTWSVSLEVPQFHHFKRPSCQHVSGAPLGRGTNTFQRGSSLHHTASQLLCILKISNVRRSAVDQNCGNNPCVWCGRHPADPQS